MVGSVAIAVAFLASCSLAERNPPAVGVTPVRPATTTTTVVDKQAQALAQAIAKSGGVELPVFFVRNGQLGAAVRVLPSDMSVVRRAVDALLAGPTPAERAAGLSTAVPSLSRVRTMRLQPGDAGDVAVLDLTGSFSALGPENSAVLRLAQIVYTLTTLPVSVRFYIDGQQAKAIGGYILPDRPLTRDDFAAYAPPVLLESVGPSQVVAPGKDISGTTAAPDVALGVRLTDATGHVLFEAITTSSKRRATRHAFHATAQYKPIKSGPGTLTIAELSPGPGAKPVVVVVPVQVR